MSKKLSKIWLFFYFLTILGAEVSSKKKNSRRYDTNVNDNIFKSDLPLKSDLNMYLRYLNESVNFVIKHSNAVDINIIFGFFLVNHIIKTVNMKNVMKHKRDALPFKIQDQIDAIITKNNRALRNFQERVVNDLNPKDELNKRIYSLFTYASLWDKGIETYDKSILSRTVQSTEKLDPYLWMSYIGKINKIEKHSPTPAISDNCMASLAKNTISYSDDNRKCELPAFCHKMLIEGTNFGYALTHRVLLLLLARRGRGCSVFSKTQDQRLFKQLCSIIYKESEFIVNIGINRHNFYEIIDLLMEQITICVYGGETQFLRRTWVHQAFVLQTPHGCFGLVPYKRNSHLEHKQPETSKWQILKKKHEIIGGLCNGHTTSVIVAVIGMATKFILEVYY